jgi:hypothetical protein
MVTVVLQLIPRKCGTARRGAPEARYHTKCYRLGRAPAREARMSPHRNRQATHTWSAGNRAKAFRRCPVQDLNPNPRATPNRPAALVIAGDAALGIAKPRSRTVRPPRACGRETEHRTPPKRLRRLPPRLTLPVCPKHAPNGPKKANLVAHRGGKGAQQSGNRTRSKSPRPDAIFRWKIGYFQARPPSGCLSSTAYMSTCLSRARHAAGHRLSQPVRRGP